MEQKKEVIEFKEEHPFHDKKRVEHLKKKARKISIMEGSASSISSGVGASYITPFAMAIGAQPIHISLISSITGLASPIAQFYSSKMIEKYSRKKIVLTFVLLQALMWLPIAFLAIAFYKNFFQNYLPIALIVLYSILTVFSGFSYPPWFSWMGDLVSENERGKYFGKRNTITGIIGLAAFMLAAVFLDSFKTHGFLLIGFAVLFALAFTFRFISFMLFHKQFSPRFKLKKGYYFSFMDFLKRMDGFGKFAVYQGLFYFANTISGPFFTIYMIATLGFNYETFTIVSISASAFYLLFMPLAGKFSDRFGNRALLWTGNILFALVPVLWLFIKSPLYLVFIPQLISGIANAALTIAFTNFVYDSVSREHCPICTAYTNILAGIGIFVGSLAGGLFIKFAPFPFKTSFFITLVITAVLIMIFGLIFLRDVRDKKQFDRLPPITLDLTHPFKTLHADIGWFRHVFGG